jgi:hypothetical protein
MRIPLPTVAVLCLIAGLARPAAAEPITVTSGVVSISDVTFPAWGFSLTGFDFQAYGEGPTPPTTGFSTCALSSCLGDTTLNLGGSISPVNAVGRATVNGTMYPNTQYPGGLLVFTTGDVVVPPASDPRQFPILSSKFAFTGTLDIAAAGPDGVFPVGSVELVGVGTATGFFSKTPTGYRLEGITYDFVNPTPEPGSLLLLATGAVMALRRVRTTH